MRAPLLIVASLALAACNKNAAVDNSADAGDQLTADSIVSNDVTAIDAVTGAAANMAADVDVNYGTEVASNAGDAATNAGSTKKATSSGSRKSAPADSSETNSTVPSAANTATNAE